MKSIVLVCACALSMLAVPAAAEEFAPTLLRIHTDPVMCYDFDGSELSIPVVVEGTPAGLILAIFTKDRAADIEYTVNGYLGWHQVNKVDTCLYFSPLTSVETGTTVLTWDGCDMDGGIAPVASYTYYIWGFDNQSEKQIMTRHMHSGMGFDMTTAVLERDESGLPLANPVWYRADERWVIGSDPSDETIVETSIIELPSGWEYRGEPCIDPASNSYYYLNAGNGDDHQATIVKLRWIPGGTAEIQNGWGPNHGFGTYYATAGGGSPGVVTDGAYLYTGDENHDTSNRPDADLYVYERTGNMIISIALTDWWSDAGDLAAGGQMNGGPDNFFQRHGNIFLNCSCSCLNQMINPQRFLDTGKYDDLFVWSNGNGDYTLDHNFEETAIMPWICNDYNVGPYKYSISADDNMFSAANAFDVGAVSFGLLAPDGTGLGYYAFAGETAYEKRGMVFIDSGTPFDGIYCDDYYDRGDYKYPGSPSNTEIYFLGHDSVKGVITYPHIDPHLYLTSTNSGGTLERGTEHQITWGYIYVSSVIIEFSHDGGETWEIVAEEVDADQRSYMWIIPNAVSDDCLIRISNAIDPGLSDMSDTPFSIVPAQGERYFLTDVSGTGNSALINIPWAINPAIDGESPTSGDELAVYTPSGLCVGAAVWIEGENLYLTVWGDDETTAETDGAFAGELLMFRIWDSETGTVHDTRAATSSGDVVYEEDALIVLNALTSGEDVGVTKTVPAAFMLGQNRPNPFNPAATIPYKLGAECRVTLAVYDVTGAKVATLVDGVFPAGRHEAVWNAAGFPSGVYFYRLTAGAFEDTGKMTLVK